jgi:cytoskeletal protein RodZ
MKKSTTITIGVLVGVVFLGGAMFAQNVSDTGPNTNNPVTQNQSSECTSTNNNNVNVNNENNQSSESGTANSTGNTNSNSSTTGSASNSSSTSTNVNINNDNNCITTQAATKKDDGNKTEVGGKGAGVSKTPAGGVAAGNIEIAQAFITVAIITGSFGAIFVGTKKLASTINS